MAHRKIDRLPIPMTETLKQKLVAKKLDTGQTFFMKSPYEIMENLDINLTDATQLYTNVAKILQPKSSTAWELYTASIFPQLSLRRSVRALQITPGLTEFVGPTNSGKTQTCLTLAVDSVLPIDNGGLKGNVLFINTESEFSVARICQIASARYPHLFGSELQLNNLLIRIHVISIHTIDEISKLFDQIEEILITENITFFVLDGIAAPVRRGYDRAHLADRQQFLLRIANAIKYLSERFQLPCIVTNQVTQTRKHFTNNAETQSFQDSNEMGLQAALGVTWAHAVNTRFILDSVSGIRRLKLAKSPSFASTAYPFTISEAGVKIEENPIPFEDDEDYNVLSMKIQSADVQIEFEANDSAF